MKKHLKIAALAAWMMATTPALAVEDYVILNINGQEVKYSEVAAIWQSVFPAENAPAFDTLDENMKQNVLRGVIGEYLLLNKALEANLEQKPEVQKKLADMRKKVMVDAFLEAKSVNDVTPAAVKEAYDKEVAEKGKQTEIRASHILVEDEKTAQQLIAKLNEGAEFDKLAKEYSTDKASGLSGGDLGYFTKDRMVKEFADAAFALKEGEVSQPVKTDFGWHVIKVTAMRERQPAPFTQERERIEQELRAEALSQYINDLVDSANVQYFNAKGEKQELTRTPDNAQ